MTIWIKKYDFTRAKCVYKDQWITNQRCQTGFHLVWSFFQIGSERLTLFPKIVARSKDLASDPSARLFGRAILI